MLKDSLIINRFFASLRIKKIWILEKYQTTNLPDESNIDEIMYRLYVVDKVKKGKEAVINGETLTLEELKNEVSKWYFI